MKLLKLTEVTGRPVYINTAHLVAVRYVEAYERDDNMSPDTVRIEMVERSYNVKESLEYILAALEGA